MTNKLEKKFFQCFGIEPRYEDSCTVEDKYWNNKELANKYGTFDQYMNCKCGNQENCTTECSCAYQREVYPQITDHILLELIIIIGKKPFGYLQCENTYSTNLGDIRDIITVEADSLKEGLLTLAMQNKVVLRIKHQVRTLFEKG